MSDTQLALFDDLESAETTQTGRQVILCDQCGKRHPITRSHCTGCNAPSLFIQDGLCLRCRGIRTEVYDLDPTSFHSAPIGPYEVRCTCGHKSETFTDLDAADAARTKHFMDEHGEMGA